MAAAVGLAVEAHPVIGNYPARRSRFSEREHAEIRTLIASIERETTGEIVPMVAERSISVFHVRPMLFLFFALGLTEMGPTLWHRFGITPFFGLELLLALGLGVSVGSIGTIQRLLTPAAERERQVRDRAQREFFRRRLERTTHRSGILIFVSLLEHQAVVIGDAAVAEKLPPGTWQSLLNESLSVLAKKGLFAGLREMVLRSGHLLKTYLPEPAKGASPEPVGLPNDIIELD